MQPIILTNDLLTGVNDIDEQHRKLFALANQLLSLESSLGGRLLVVQAIAFLGQYVDYHFAAEELAMKESSFPDYTEHRTFHESFREQVGDIAEEAQSGAPPEQVIRRVAALVTDWLVTHIRFMDRALGQHLVSQPNKTSIHLPSQSRLVDEGLVPSDYVIPDSTATRE